MPNKIILKKKIFSFRKKISIPGDKSISIRWVLISSLANGVSKAKNLLMSGDVLTIKMLQEIIVNLQQENQITICICDHQARDLLACVDIAMILSNCKIIAQDTPSNLVKDINARNAYFGNSFKFN